MPVIRLRTPNSRPAKWSGTEDDTGSWLDEMFGATSRSERAGDTVDGGPYGGVLGSFNRFSDKSFSIRLIRSASCEVFCLCC